MVNNLPGRVAATSYERHPGKVTATLVSGTAAYNVAQNVVFPAWSYVPLNAAATVGLFKLAEQFGLTREEVAPAGSTCVVAFGSGPRWAV